MADPDPPAGSPQIPRPPDDLCDMAFACEIMDDPVVAADGYTYNRKEITLWFAQHNTSPKTSQVLPHKMLIPNLDLRSRIIAWRESHGLPPPRIANPDDLEPAEPVVAAGGAAAIQKPEVAVTSELDLVFICDCTGRLVQLVEPLLAFINPHWQYGQLHSSCARQHHIHCQGAFTKSPAQSSIWPRLLPRPSACGAELRNSRV